jgi:hypothetical protein
MTLSEAAELDQPRATSAEVAGSMAQDEHKGVRRAMRPVRTAKGVEDAFDVWLHRGLHQLYDAVAKEPLPPELLQLIEEDRAGLKKAEGR